MSCEKVLDQFSACWERLEDLRSGNAGLHDFHELLVIALCAVLCSGQGAVDMALFAKAKGPFLRGFLKLENGVPGHDTFSRLFRNLAPEQFWASFQRFMAKFSEHCQGVVTIDGKVLRRSFDRASGKSALHMVSAWGCEQPLVLAQTATAKCLWNGLTCSIPLSEALMGRIAKSILLSPQCKAGVDWLEDHLPLLKKWHRFEYEQHFERVYQWQRMFFGAWPSFEVAEKAIPVGRTAGFDHLETAAFLGQKANLCASDYPVIYWLRELMGPTTRIFDFGGYNGISYRSYARLLHFPDGLEWTVYDVPAVIAVAKRKQQERPSTEEKHLRFTDKLEDASNANIFLASGSLHYCKETLAEHIQSLVTRPRYILLNKLPLTEGPAFVTLQNIGPAVTPYKVFNVGEFTGEIKALGYRTVDTWNNPDVSCYVPFHPDKTVREFTGMLFCLE